MLCCKCYIGSPLLTRGAQLLRQSRYSVIGITPAHAGSTYNEFKGKNKPRDHPCSRGEHEYYIEFNSASIGSPLLTRGAQHLQKILVNPYRITPAHAGSTLLSINFSVNVWDHPCSRGEHVY